MSAGATYDGWDSAKAMNLPAQVLQTGSAGNPQGRYDARDLTFVMGHELQHGFNHHAQLKATRTFLDDIRQQPGAQGQAPDDPDALRATHTAGRKAETTDENESEQD